MRRVIEVRNLSKRYILGDTVGSYGNLRESVMKAVLKPWRALRKTSSSGRQRPPVDNVFWALKNVNLDVEQGDNLAVIGSNGAGKTTLLKILSRITHPTEGSIKVNGHLASLLEV